MRLKKATLVAILALSVSGCAAVDVVTRAAPFTPSKQLQAQKQSLEISEVRVNVSRELRVSEAELYYPQADIVWRGDAKGDRHQQVATIFRESAATARGKFHGATKARLEIDVQRFHALTNKARYTVGGVHSIGFIMSFKDPVTGVNLVEPRKVSVDLEALSGQAATRADARGETQKQRIVEHLSQVIGRQIAGGIAPETPVVARNVTALPANAGSGSIY